jgi:hypothetical protein
MDEHQLAWFSDQAKRCNKERLLQRARNLNGELEICAACGEAAFFMISSKFGRCSQCVFIFEPSGIEIQAAHTIGLLTPKV